MNAFTMWLLRNSTMQLGSILGTVNVGFAQSRRQLMRGGVRHTVSEKAE